MRPASTLGPLAVSALALLVEAPMHPYEMYQLLLSRSQDRIVKVRPGSLYHTVSKLAELGYVEATGTDREGNRPERTTYAITVDGRLALKDRVVELLETPVNDYPIFALAAGEAHNLPRATVLALLRRRLEGLQRERDVVTARETVAIAGGVPRRYWLSADYVGAHLDADIAWVSALISDLDSDSLAWDADSHDDASSGLPNSTSTQGTK